MYSLIDISLVWKEFKYQEIFFQIRYDNFYRIYFYIGLDNKKPAYITLYYLFTNNNGNLRQNQCLWVPLHE
jgi:hypothetical protein